MQTLWQPAIEIVEPAKDAVEAQEILAGLQIQVGHQTSRVIEPTPAKPGFRVQAIMETNGEYPNGWLPDGCKHVMWRGYL